MSKLHVFIEKYFSRYLDMCQGVNPFIEEKGKTHLPPTSDELEELISYLLDNDLNPVIIGALAVIKHLNINSEDLRNRQFRPTNDIDIFISHRPHALPPGWRLDKETDQSFYWLSPSGSYADLTLGSIEKDPESVAMGCPVASLKGIIKMKLKLGRSKDMEDLLSLVRRTGMPQNLGDLSPAEAKNLAFVQEWAKLRLKEEK